MTGRIRRLAAAGLVVYLVVLADVTLTPLVENPFLRGNSVPFRSIGAYLTNDPTNVALRNLGGNLVLLAPLGLYLGWRWSRVALPAAVAVAVSCCIETCQVVLPGRVGDVDDIILNGAGGFVGAVLGGAAARWAPPSTTIDVQRSLAAPGSRSVDATSGRQVR